MTGYSVFIRYISLLLVGVLAGNSFAFVMGMGTAIQNLSPGSYVELHQSMDQTCSYVLPSLYFVIIGLLGVNIYALRSDWKSTEFILVVFSFICILDEVIMTWVGNLPLSRMIYSWQISTPPAEWMQARTEWLRFMYIRSALLVSCFGLLLASSFFMKRNLASRKDVFVAA